MGVSCFLKWSLVPNLTNDDWDIREIPPTHIEIPGVIDMTIDGQKIYNSIQYGLNWGVSWGVICTFAALFGKIVFCYRSSTAILLYVIIVLALTGIDGFFLQGCNQAKTSVNNFEKSSIDKLKSQLKSQLIGKYDHQNSDPQLMDVIQNQLGCCGFDNYRDWNEHVPDSCLKDAYRSRPDCGEKIRKVQDSIDYYLKIVLGVFAAITAAHALLALLGLFLIYLFLRK